MEFHRARGFVVVTALSALWGVGCSSNDSPGDLGTPAAAPQVPVPPANGPRLAALKHRLAIYNRPSLQGEILGTLRMGGQVARAEQPYTTGDCPGGWYPIRPRGFVCVGPDATLDLQALPARTLSEEPDEALALPYRYGRVKSGGGVLYSTLPSAAEQLAAEPKLHRRKPSGPKRLGAGANDVPLDDEGFPSGPPVVRPNTAGVNANGYRMRDAFFSFTEASTPRVATGASLLGSAATARRVTVVNRGSGIAVANSFDTDEGERARRFGILPDGRFIPLDRLEPAQGTTWHGADVRKISLPMAFTLRPGVRPWELQKGRATTLDDEFDARTAIPLSGRFRTLRGQRYYFAREGHWIRARDIYLLPKRHKYPEWATGEQKWLDISLANQTLVAWQGRTPVYATLLSSGQDRLGDAKTGPATPRGVFKIKAKHITAVIDRREVGQRHTVLEAPWAMDLDGESIAITGAYWIRNFGDGQGFHNIALSPIDARWLYHWSGLRVPDGWHSVTRGNTDETTIVYIHK